MVLADPVRTAEGPDATSPGRLRSVDLARGLAVLGMVFVDNRGNDAISAQFVHAAWNGLRAADVVFPVFLLIVGVSMPWSRRAQRPRTVVWRVVKLAALGWLIVTAKYGWGVIVPGVLGHIAGAYLLCWLLLRLPYRAQLPVAGGLLGALTVLFVLVPVPGLGRTSLTPEQSWAAWFDQSIGLSFAAEMPHSYLPSAVTVFIGVLAGRLLQARPGPSAVLLLAGSGTGLVVVGLASTVLVPMNKHVWTPSYVLVTGGIGLLLLAGGHWLVDVRGVHRPFRPAEVLGLNAIVAFAISELLFRAVLSHTVQPVVVTWLATVLAPTAAAYLYPAAALAVVWAACAFLARRGIVVRI